VVVVSRAELLPDCELFPELLPDCELPACELLPDCEPGVVLRVLLPLAPLAPDIDAPGPLTRGLVSLNIPAAAEELPADEADELPADEFDVVDPADVAVSRMTHPVTVTVWFVALAAPCDDADEEADPP